MNTLTATPCRVCESRSYVEHEDVTIGEETFRVCDVCLADHDGPGKFEGNGDDLALALVLYSLDMDGGADYFLSDESGYAAQFGRYVLCVSDRGFVSIEDCGDETKSLQWLSELEDEGFGADENDGWISYERTGIRVSLGGKNLGTFDTLRRAKAAVSVEMRRSGYYPNVFLAGEHGPTVRRIEVW